MDIEQNPTSAEKYIGDAKLQKLLEHYKCKAPIYVIKMRFLGALCSPNLTLSPAQIITSFWEDGKSPRLETKSEAEIFFASFMGLWHLQAKKIKKENIRLNTPSLKPNSEELRKHLQMRIEEIEYGFLEAFWGGVYDLDMPTIIAELIDSISELVGVYDNLLRRLSNDSGELDFDSIIKTASQTDAMAEKGINAVCKIVKESRKEKQEQETAEMPTIN